MTNWEILRPYLPAEWIVSLAALPVVEQEQIQEIRLRAGEPVTLSTPTGKRFLDMASATTLHQPSNYICRREQLEACFMRFCEESVYAHEEELRQGFIAVSGGVRVGVAGTAVLADGQVRAVRQVTSLCVRLPREHVGCAASLLPLVYPPDGVQSTLLVGEPSSGKTSLLRDIAVSLAVRHVQVAVVDERGEISGVNGLAGCDVLRGHPKATGILQAVRCLAPQVVLFDELGAEEEIRAVAACAHAGVAVVASLHGRNPYQLQVKPVIRELVTQGVFDQWVFLRGRHDPGVWKESLTPEVRCGEICWHSADRGGGDRAGDVLFTPLVPQG